MNTTKEKILSGLERAFARGGFAEPSVEDLRAAAGVSLRTLYKYTPSRERMVHEALEHRHRRYIDRLFTNLPDDPGHALDAIVDRAAGWMETEASHGCMFHGAVAAAPGDRALHDLLLRHKGEVARRAAAATGLAGREVDLMLILEGLSQAWPLQREAAVASARRLAASLRDDA